MTKQKNGFVFIEIWKVVYDLPPMGVLANKLLKESLNPDGYYEVSHTTGLWKHITRSIQFTLAVGEFGVKYQGK